MDNRGLAAATQVLNNDDLDHFSNLHRTSRFADIMKKVEHGLMKIGSDTMSELRLVLEEDDDPLIVQCKTLCADIDNEIWMIRNFIADKYCLKFPQLVSILRHPIDYARVVKKIGNAVDLTLVDLKAIMPSDAIISLGLSVSPTSLRLLLPEDVLEKTIKACDRAILLHASKKKVLTYVKYRMRSINSTRKLAKKYRESSIFAGHGRLSQCRERFTVSRIKQISATPKIFKTMYLYSSGETTPRVTSSFPFKPAQVPVHPQAEDSCRLGSQVPVHPQAEDARILGSQIQALHIS